MIIFGEYMSKEMACSQDSSLMRICTLTVILSMVAK